MWLSILEILTNKLGKNISTFILGQLLTDINIKIFSSLLRAVTIWDGYDCILFTLNWQKLNRCPGCCVNVCALEYLEILHIIKSNSVKVFEYCIVYGFSFGSTMHVNYDVASCPVVI